MKFYLIVIAALLGSAAAYSQKGNISGVITDANNTPVPFITVSLDNTTIGAETNEKGAYLIENVDTGDYTLSASGFNYEKASQLIHIGDGAALTLNFALQENHKALDGVTIIGLSETDKINKQAYNVTAIEAKKLYNTTLDLSQALDRVSGVRVRETGGVGSSTNFSLNGFSGNQVRFFLDGIPMDNFGAAFQINNIPINFAQRVEVYKGVVPVWLGSDALGGAVNIITGNNMRNYLDVSYSYGSFNTHRSNISAAYTSKKGFTVQLNAFQNYSDNDYTVNVDVADPKTGIYTPDQPVRRFHDRYHNEVVKASIGFVDKKWADQFLVGFMGGSSYMQIQTGARMEAVFGGRLQKGNLLMPTLTYKKKNFLVDGLDLVINANYNFGAQQSIDTQFRRYDWYGNYIQLQGPGGEAGRTLYKYSDNTGLLTTTLFYAINDRQTLALNNVFSTFDRIGKDELVPDDLSVKQPRKDIKNITGLSYKYDVNDKWTATAFTKMLYQKAFTRIETEEGWGNYQYIDRENKTNSIGYGIATSYYVTPQVQAKLSYEKSYRLPENNELFGDVINQESNFDLKPEKSDNINLGLNYYFSIAENHHFMVAGTGIYRYAKDFIRLTLANNQVRTIAYNLASVSNIGGEMEMRYSYKNLFSIEANGTYQNIRNQEKIDPKTKTPSSVYKDRIPNLPYLFAHGGATVFLDHILTKGDKLSIGYNFLYVHSFFLYWPSMGSDKRTIPAQLSHDVNLVYTLKNGRYNIALECRDFTNARLYDNYSLQKPGRSFAVKLRYFYNKL